MLVLVGPRVSANAIAINKDVGVHTKMPLNVRTRVVSPTGIAERTASLEIRLKLQLASGLRGGRIGERVILIPCSAQSDSLFAYFKIPCSVISKSQLFRNRELPSGKPASHLRYVWPRIDASTLASPRLECLSSLASGLREAASASA